MRSVRVVFLPSSAGGSLSRSMYSRRPRRAWACSRVSTSLALATEAAFDRAAGREGERDPIVFIPQRAVGDEAQRIGREGLHAQLAADAKGAADLADQDQTSRHGGIPARLCPGR